MATQLNKNAPMPRQELLQILNEMRGDIRELKTDVSTLNNRVDILNNRVDVLTTKVEVLGSDVIYLKNSVNDLYYHRRHDIDILEQSRQEFVYSKLSEELPSMIIKKLPLKLFYNPKGLLITDLDGCILIDSSAVKANLTKGYLDNTRHINPTIHIRECIVIESKTAITLERVNTKLRQMYLIQSILQLLPTMSLNKTSIPFQNMVEDYELKKVPHSVNLIFAADDISSEVNKYILAINNGITKEEYDSLIPVLLKSDPLYFLKLKTDNTIPQKVKQRIHKLKTRDDIVALVKEDSLKKYHSSLQNYLITYEDLEPFFTTFKGKLGIVQFHTLQFPKFIS